jgi:hypothetical protein
MITTRTHFTFRVDTWTADGESIVEHVAGVEESALSVKFPLPQSPAYYLPLRCDRDDGCPLYPSKRTFDRRVANVRFVPKADSCSAAIFAVIR